MIKMKNEEIQLKTQQVRELQEQLALLKEQIDHQVSSNQQIITDKSKSRVLRLITVLNLAADLFFECFFWFEMFGV